MVLPTLLHRVKVICKFICSIYSWKSHIQYKTEIKWNETILYKYEYIYIYLCISRGSSLMCLKIWTFSKDANSQYNWINIPNVFNVHSCLNNYTLFHRCIFSANLTKKFFLWLIVYSYLPLRVTQEGVISTYGNVLI